VPKSIFAYIMKYSLRQQLIALAGTLIYLPILYLTFELPKIIVNDALDAEPAGFPIQLFGWTMDQLPYLFVLCGILLGLVLITGGMRYVLSVYKGVLGETMLRRLRYDLYRRILQFPLSHMKKIQSGEIVTMATAEAEPLGRFMGVAVANPTLQGGTMVTALVFLFAQDWLLGIAAIALFPLQAWLVPKFQKRMNAWSRKRLVNVRLFAGHVNETMSGYQDIHVHNTTSYELARAAHHLGTLFRIRRALYKLGNGIIFLNNFFTQLTPFLFYAIGGYLVIMGDLSLGALIAVIAAYRETAAPWNELLEYYQSLEDNRVKYAALVENFSPDGLRELPPTERPDRPSDPAFDGALTVNNVTLKEGEETVVDQVSLDIPCRGRVAILGPAGSGKTELAHLLSTLERPSSGGIDIGGQSLKRMSADTRGRCMAYLSRDAHVFTGTWRENIQYGLKHQPQSEDGAHSDEETQAWRAEALAAGNTTLDPQTSWLDLDELGFADAGALQAEADRLVRLSGLEEDLYHEGMRLSLAAAPEALRDMIKTARQSFRQELADNGIEDAVEFFDPDRFNANASVAENLWFGAVVTDYTDPHQMAANPSLLDTLRRHDLLDCLLQAGHVAISHIVSMFRDLGADDARLGQFSLIDTDEMAAYESLLRRIPNLEKGPLSDADQAMVLGIALQLTPAKHRLGLIKDDIQERIVMARHAIRDNPPLALAQGAGFHDAARGNDAASVRQNILFGHMSRAKGQHRDKVEEILKQVVIDNGLEPHVVSLGMDAHVGISGARLTPGQKQRLALVRCLIKKPEVLIINHGLSALEQTQQDLLLHRIVEDCPSCGLIWIASKFSDAQLENRYFQRTYTMRGGRIVDDSDTSERKAEPSSIGQPMAETLAADIQLLDGVELLDGIEAATLKLLAFTSSCLRFDDGEYLFESGTIGDAAYIVSSGEVEICIGDTQPRHVIGLRGRGALIGEMALLSDAPRTACVRAKGTLTVLRIERQTFLDLVRQDANLGLAVMRLLSDRLGEATRRMETADENSSAHE
jgi:putative ABC transport system ATP-binding protein